MNHDQVSAPEPVIASCKPRRGLGELLRSAAGATMGWRPNRRGSFLVIVVGTLALLAVMALIYSTIGTHDAKMVFAADRHARLDDVPKQVADYITTLISADTLSVYYESKDDVPGNVPVPMLRKVSDYPSTSWFARVGLVGSGVAAPLNLNNVNATFPFNPTGSASGFITTPDYSMWNAGNMPRAWAPSSPWLSSTESTYLDFNGAGPTVPARPYLDLRDIAHISNIAPDGRFVNLVNLRGNFDAKSGTGPDPDGKPRMSTNLTLFDASGRAAVSNGPDFGGTLVLDCPAMFDSRQQWMFRAARPTPGKQPNDPTYEPNQYASPDGSGMYTARIQELKDSRFLTDILHTDGKFRYFVSARIIDASALVNVNTAGDMHAAPTAASPAGSSPLEIDLRRVLSMIDSYSVNGPLGSGQRGGYDGIFQPAVTTVPSSYGSTAPPNTTFPPPNTNSGYDQIRAQLVGTYAYTSLRLALAGGTIPPADFRGVASANPLNFSLTADFPGGYGVPSRGWDTAGATPSNPYLGFADPYLRGEFFRDRALSFGDTVYTGGGTPSLTFTGGFGINDLGELLTWRGANDPAFTSSLELAIDGRDDTNLGSFPDSTRFGPLRSNRGLDIEHDLRYSFPATGTPSTSVGSPYDRTMLHFAADIRQRLTTISGGREFRQSVTAANALVNPIVVVGVNPDQLSPGELKVDPRPILSSIKNFETSLLATPLNQALLRQKGVAINALFSGYADALLPTSGVGKAWNGDPTRNMEAYGQKGPELAIHAAGHAALNMIDMFDKGGVPTVQTLLLNGPAGADGGFVQNHAAQFPTWVRSPNPNSPTNGLQLPRWRLGDMAAGAAVQTAAVNIYGVEAQPFLTQVASFTVYADATTHATIASGPGDDDASSGSQEITIDGTTNFATNSDLMYRVVAFQLTNPFGVDVTLGTLPDQYSYYDVADPNYPPLDREANFYYVKFGDKVYKLASLQEAVYTPPPAVAPPTPHPPAIADATWGQVGGRTGDVYIQGAAPDRLLSLHNITIPAGKTIVCYALSDIPRRILADRLAKLTNNPTGDPGAGYFNDMIPATGLQRKEQRDELQLAIEHELGRGDPDVSGVYWIPEMDVTTGAGLAILPHDTNVFPTAATTEVSLWRAMRYGNVDAVQQAINVPGQYWDGSPSGPNPTPSAPPHNDWTNDQLVDRIRIPGAVTAPNTSNIEASLPAGQQRVSGTGGGASPVSADPNFLYMITTHASVRRRADPRPDNGKPPLGAIPAYCLEPKFDPAWNTVERDSLATLSDNDFTGTTPFKGGGSTVRQWVRRMQSQSGLDSGPTTTYTFNKAPGAITAPVIATTDPNATGTAVKYDTLYPQININDAEFLASVPTTSAPNGTKVSTLRAADLLLPLGIGPEEMPLDASGTPITDMDRRWTTLSEALALAMGYQTNPPTPITTPDATYPYYVAAGIKTPLDRGNLRLDDDVPFFDSNGDGMFDPAADRRLGLEIPLALNVLDIFTISPTDNRDVSTNAVPIPILQSLTSPTHGKLNISTASTQTVRSALSMLSPPPQMDDIGGNPWWWWAPSATVAPPLNGGSTIASAPPAADIAATLTAYRDKKLNVLRPISQFTSAGGVTVDSVYFTDSVVPNLPEGQLNGRGLSTQVGSQTVGGSVTSALHERPGFSSVGEMAIMRFRDGAATPDPTSPAWPTNMDWLGHDTLPVPAPSGPGPAPVAGNSGLVGLDSVLYPDPATAGAKIPDRVKNDYKEQLEVLNSVIGNVTTRSDYFIVWFQIQGYQKSDVENLGDNDPMTPSINRRFVMVVDRSKVTRRGDKADVLLFKEVPVDSH